VYSSVNALPRRRQPLDLKISMECWKSRKASSYCSLYDSAVYYYNMVIVVGLVITVWLRLLAPSEVFAADVVPPARLPEKGSEAGPAITPENPSESGTPAIPPSKIDPGIQQRPPTNPDPRAAVPPPNIDPKMSVDPEKAPPANKAKKPRGENKRPKEPRER
jgi:hypothetical protein